MNDYTFSTLNDKELELLSLDLLNEKYDLKLKSFKSGKDGGIDLRYSTCTENNEIVVQVKHLVGSKYAQLKHNLYNSELPKVKKLAPQRYIIVTSLALSATEMDELRQIMSPYIISQQDIIDQVELNNLLRNHPKVEGNHFKLWFSSVGVLQTILNNALAGRTRAYLENVQSKITYYVVTPRIDEASEILSREKLLLISGQPGIGKSTLADILLFARAKNGYKIYKVYNIDEAEAAISPDDNEKQLFYYDDFLGEIYYQVQSASQYESLLTSFVERIKNTPNKYLILTTRTVILNQATQQSEKINHSDIADKQFELKLNDYSSYEKAQILYNHLYANYLSPEVLGAILNDKFYLKIIQHKNYTPRIIESITKPSAVNDFHAEEYRDYVLSNLNNPEKIWSSSFTNQIKYFDQRLLLTLFTFPSGVEEIQLQTAFNQRLAYEKNENNQVIKASQFKSSLKMLLNGFITSYIVSEAQFMNEDKVKREFKLINPSLSDYIAGYLNESYMEKKGIISSVEFLEQLTYFNPQNGMLKLEKELQLIIRQKVEDGNLQSIDRYQEYRLNGLLLETLSRYCNTGLHGACLPKGQTCYGE